MTIITKHYDPPLPFNKAMPGARKLVIMKRIDDCDDGFTKEDRLVRGPSVSRKPNDMVTKVDTMNDIDRGPYYKMLDRQALAHQAQFGGTYEQAFAKCYTAPENIAIRYMAQYEHLAKSHDVMFGTKLSSIPVQKAAPEYDPLRKAAELAEIRGPAHAKLHSMAIDYQRAHAGVSYSSAYSHEYIRPENASLREKIKNEHLSATMAGLGGEAGKAAEQDYVDPGVRTPTAHAELDALVAKRMRSDPKLSYERAFTKEYLLPENRLLKSRVDAESILHAQRRAPAPAFPAYGR
jgi:hypothetical protein